jgi:4-hydroxy-tetrahydrodipicolinate synthase
MVTAINQGDYATARRLHLDLLELHQAMFIEANPVPVKTSASLMGLCAKDVRLPLCELQPANLEKLQAILKKYALI